MDEESEEEEDMNGDLYPALKLYGKFASQDQF